MNVTDLTPLGYDISEVSDGLYRVEGYGGQWYIADGDDSILPNLLDPAQHKERVFRYEHPEVDAILVQLEERGIEVSLDFGAQKVLVTKPGDAQPTAYTPAQVKSYVDGLPAFDPYKAVRDELAAATTVPQLKTALGHLLDKLASER